jgi:hypothetical protein
LADTDDELSPITGERERVPGGRCRPQPAHRVNDRVAEVLGKILGHAGEAVTGQVPGPAEPTLHGESADVAGRFVTVGLDRLDREVEVVLYPTLGGGRVGVDDVPGGDGGVLDVLGERGRGVDAEEHGGVERVADGLLERRAELGPHVETEV